MSDQKNKQRVNKAKIARTILSWLLIGGGITILLLVFAPLAKQEIIFQYHQATKKQYYYVEETANGKEEIPAKGQQIIPQSTDFGIVIPKINANAPVFANVDPFKEGEFLPILKKGVAHAKNTSFPGQGENIYLFAHSASGPLQIKQYNAVFYLLSKLEQGDRIIIFYKEKPYSYYVFEKKIIGPEKINYLEKTGEEILTLQTCYPAGTTLKRLIIRAKPGTPLDNR